MVEKVVKAVLLGILAYKAGEGIFEAIKDKKNKDKNGEEVSNNPDEEEKKEEEPTQGYQLTADHNIESLTCPITMELISEPATTIHGHLYELSAIRDWVRKKGVCPMTQ